MSLVSVSVSQTLCCGNVTCDALNIMVTTNEDKISPGQYNRLDVLPEREQINGLRLSLSSCQVRVKGKVRWPSGGQRAKEALTDWHPA